MVAEYFAARRRRPHARAPRPADRAGALALRRPEGMQLATGPQDENADAFYQKRVPKGAPDYLETVEVTFPSGRTADEICPTEIAVPVWCAHMGTLTFHPWPVRRADVDHPDELRIDLDPQPGTTFTDAVRVAGVARELLEELGLVGYPKTSRQPRRAHLRADRAAVGVHRPAARRDRVRPRAGPARRRRDDRLVEGGAGRADLRRLQPEQPRPHHRLGLLPAADPGRAGLDADDLGRAGRRSPTRGDYNLFTVPDRMADGDPWAAIDDTAYSPRAAAAAVGGAARRRAELPAGLPQDARRAAARAAVEEGRGALGRARQPDRGT